MSGLSEARNCNCRTDSYTLSVIPGRRMGSYVDWAANEHGAALIGYRPQTVTIADPISGVIEYNREQ